MHMNFICSGGHVKVQQTTSRRRVLYCNRITGFEPLRPWNGKNIETKRIIYKQHIPLVNACRPPGKWQSYDIVFRAPRFKNDGSLESPAYVTVIHNGVLIQNHVELLGPTEFIGKPSYKPHPEKLSLMLQDHSNPVSYRNIWIREL